jgi:hypothetical protein
MPAPRDKIVALKRGSLPAKACKVCGESIEFTRRTARDWEAIKYCSAVCRRNRTTPQRMPMAS